MRDNEMLQSEILPTQRQSIQRIAYYSSKASSFQEGVLYEDSVKDLLKNMLKSWGYGLNTFNLV